MTKHLYKNLILSHFLIGILGMCFVFLSGFFFIENHLKQSLQDSFGRHTQLLLENEDFIKNVSEQNYASLSLPLHMAANSKDAVLLLLNSKGTVVFSTESEEASFLPVTLNCTSEELSNINGSSGTFFQYFSKNYFHIVTPIQTEDTILGYLSLHYDAEILQHQKSNRLFFLITLFVLFYGLSFLLLVIYRIYIDHPLKKIIDGAASYSSGNISHRISVHSNNEMGYLANTLNYMADRINQNSEYQRNFISNVSHDFRSPLTSIKGFIQAILDGTIPIEQQEKYLHIIAYETDRLEKLTRGLLTLNELDARKQLLHRQCFDIHTVIRAIATAFETRCQEKNIVLTLKLSSSCLYAFADMGQIQQVLYNLLDNAIKFSHEHSSVIVETKTKNEKIFVSVKDYGIGIPREVLPHIWDRFYKISTSRGKNGSGLGLSIVKEIIHAHDQHINVVSTVDAGTEFIFSLEKAKT